MIGCSVAPAVEAADSGAAGSPDVPSAGSLAVGATLGSRESAGPHATVRTRTQAGTQRNVNIIEVKAVEQTYQSAHRALTVLHSVDLCIEEGEVVAIIGPSGSGKTTLLGLLAGLDVPARGSIQLDGHTLEALSEDERAQLRARSVGFVFQNFQLMPTLTALENVQVPLELLGESARDSERRAESLLARVGLADRADHLPNQLSGGEQQRVALARAFANRPKILFADEPTGNLDLETGGAVIEMLLELNRDAGTTLILVTHDRELAGRCEREIQLSGGRIVGDQRRHAP